ncbi:receptor-type tyrosine-protein phosphatase eta-like isoform X3 [Haliotis rubra]|uniref:receptor-type tyrosine-protein phosphatase eta-like isoform X3 n=1 Tax=Haliotis rubra TaxID=36100 RepID=UPI001EE56F29|nr:receptor-type tyrosine-protein phosphatase eta-like isoform X3 [Haliotis rubra]
MSLKWICVTMCVVYLPVMTLQGTTADTTEVNPTTTTAASETTSQMSMLTSGASPSSEPDPSKSTSDTPSTTQPSTTPSPPTPTPTTTPSSTMPSAIPVGSNCTNETQCMTPSTCNDSVCTCPEEYYQKDQQCEKRRQVGERCTNRSECVVNADCSSNTCTCLEDFFQKDMKCIPTIPVGSNCTNEKQCMTPSTCNDSVCTCPEEYYQKDQQCEDRPQVGETCTNRSECVVNADCSSNTCQCLEDFFQKDMKCIPRAQVGQGCNDSAECLVNAVCSNNTCTCLEDFFQKDMKCIPRVLPGESCENQTSCVENAVCVSTNYTCQCRPGWMVNESMCTPKETRYVENLKPSSKTSSSVLVTFDGPLDYNKFQLDVNTSTPRCIVLRRNASQEHCSACKIEAIEPPRDKRIEYNVTGLEAFTLYEIKVAMVKCNNGSSEGSRPATVTERTDTAVPNVVNRLTTCRDDSCLVCAMWHRPDPYPGPVTYRVDIFDEVNKKVVKETNESATSVCYTKEDVSPFLRYTIGVSAFTTAGQGMETRTTSMEIQFLGFKIITAEGVCKNRFYKYGNYRQMTIQWSEPDIGTTISSYLVTANKETHNITSKADRAGTNYSDVFNVTPGQTYTFKIQVRDNGTLYNVSSESKCRAPIGVPPKWPEGIQPSPVVTDTQFTLNIDFFNNDTNGPITKRSLYMSLHKKMLEVPDHQAGDVRGTKIGCCRVSGGFMENCRTGYCRTHLGPDTVYYYLAVVCTEKGCSYSPIFDFRTDKDNTTAIVVAMLVTSIIVAAIIIGAALLWRSKKVNMMPVRISLRKPDLSRIPRERPMLLSELENRVTQMHADSNLQFSVDYENIIRISPKHTNHASQIDENKQKNRWVNVLPFDHSRVILQVLDDDETSDYINASYMPGYNYENEYIASQGPLPGTVDDFWRMIWEKKVSIIVMVTPVKENGKVKCEEYWPAEVQEPKEYGDIVVENTSFSSLNTYNVTVFQLRNGEDKDVRVVKHFHFLNWKDMSADVERSDILDFVRTVRSHLRPDMEGPIVVHCSAGVGRTGTFICLDYLIQYIEKHHLSDTVDIYRYVMKLRNNRVLMVQTETQYVFIHDCAKQLVEEKRLALERPDSVVDVEEEEEEEG